MNNKNSISSETNVRRVKNLERKHNEHCTLLIFLDLFYFFCGAFFTLRQTMGMLDARWG